MKAACWSQACCWRIGREVSQPGPWTSVTAKVAMSGTHVHKPMLAYLAMSRTVMVPLPSLLT